MLTISRADLLKIALFAFAMGAAVGAAVFGAWMEKQILEGHLRRPRK